MNHDVECTSAGGLLTLLALRGIGPKGAERIARQFDRLSDVFEASPKRLSKVVSRPALNTLSDQRAWENASARTLRILEEAQEHSVRVLGVNDSGYPELLRLIPDRPPVIYVKGELLEEYRQVACVGTREPSRFGEVITQHIATLIAKNGWSVVSGLAFGVDTLAHQAALAAGGHTVAVLPNGLDTVYPKRNMALAERILGSGGALLSEHPVGTLASVRGLVRRDRLQSGLSCATVLVQSDYRGGSMHTVRFALLQGRQLFVPMPTGRYAKHPKFRAVLALCRYDGEKLSRNRFLKPDRKYRKLLRGCFRDQPPATPLDGRKGYRDLLSHLEGGFPSGREDSDREAPSSQLALF